MSLLRKLTNLLGLSTDATAAPGVQVIDLRSDEERLLAERAHAGESLGPDNEPLVLELIEIGSRREFLILDEDNKNVHSARAKVFGRILADRGGKPLMTAAYYRVRAKCGSTLAEHLSAVWNGVGGWMF